MSGTSFDAIDAAVADFELIGDAVRLRPVGAIGVPYDDDLRAEIAAAATVFDELLERLLADPYYARRPPKSTGKEHFNLAYLGDLTPYAATDVLATLTRLTATTIADAAEGVTELIASGGGVKNRTLLRELGTRIPIRTSDALGLPAQAKEAYAFALLGFLSFHGLPGTLPSATGARHASVLGSITPGVVALTRVRLPPQSPRILHIA
jgi:anhydro-N-acetylmuramic acid kinase